MKISIVGFGYIGAVIGAVYAELGHSVHAIDSNESSMNDLNQGICHVPEPALRKLIKKGVENKNLSGSTSYDSILGSDVVLVTVGTLFQTSLMQTCRLYVMYSKCFLTMSLMAR